MIKLINGDCLIEMPKLAENSVNLAILDLPYNISKAGWDKWKKKADYIEWVGNIILGVQRTLSDNGSLYFFHNDMEQIAVIMEWIRKNTKFVFKQFIVWNKKFEGSWNQLNSVVSAEGLRNYSKQAEYILFYTFQDETGLTTVMLDINNFSTLRQYFKDYQAALGLSLKKINDKLGHRKAEHAFYWKSTQWDLPTAETYAELGQLEHGEFVRREYEDLRREYEDLRYTFNNQKTHHSVWNYEIAKGNGHETPKPEPLIENIIMHSSNEGDTILDPTFGSGTTAAVCFRTGRNFIGIEKDLDYFKIAQNRINSAQPALAGL